MQNYKGVVFAIAGLIAGLSGGCTRFTKLRWTGQLRARVVDTSGAVRAVRRRRHADRGIIGVSMIDLFSYYLSQLWETGWPIVLGFCC